MTFALFVVIVNLIFSGVAVATNLWAGRHSSGYLRLLFAGTSFLSAVYFGSFFWLVFNMDQAATWSAWLRPVGMLSWLVAWTAPPWVIVNHHTRFSRRLVDDARRKLDV
jgi:hypothetical protein